jgi:thiamine-monophosphate kinase
MDPETINLAMEFKIAPSICALSGGEDYELLFTVKQEDYSKIEGIAGISVIGHMTPENGGRNLITTDGKTFELTAQGWDALRQ